MTNQQGAPEALRLADAIDPFTRKSAPDHLTSKVAADELRRLAAHVQNPAEIEHVAGDVSQNGPESNMTRAQVDAIVYACRQAGDDSTYAVVNAALVAAQQPAPSAAAEVIDLIGKLVQAESNKTRTHQEYMGKAMPDDVYARFQRLRDETTPALRTQLLDALAASPQPSPTPQADSQPAPDLDIAVMQLAESVGLIGPASRVHDLHAAIQRFHDLICVNATIKAAVMAADAIRGAARAPADSVTAPAGGAAVIPQGWRLVPEVPTQLMVNAAKWNVDGRLSVFKWADGYYAMLAAAPTPPAQAADSVREDVANYRWIRDGGDLDVIVKSVKDPGRWETPYVVLLQGEELDAAIDAARKQGANHD